MGARSSRLLGARLGPVTAGTTVLVALLGGVVWWGVAHLGFLSAARHGSFVAWTLIAWTIFVLAILLLRLLPPRITVILVMVGAVLIGLAALAGPPNTSTDSARYAWDGIVQLHGISPYAHVPASHALADLRPDWLFPAPAQVDGAAVCKGARIMSTTGSTTHDLLCTAINRPGVPTIYPPLAELWFALIRSLVPVTAAYWPMQVAGLLVSLGVTAGLLVALRRTVRPLWWAALWAWCPLVASEAVTNSHVDVLGAALATAGATLIAFRRPLLGGIALGAAVAVKLIPVIVYPPLLRDRRNWWILTSGIGVFALLYVPYVALTGIKVLGYLPGYLSEEGYDDGTRYALVSLVAHGGGATLVVGALAALAAVIAWRLSDPRRPWSAEVLLIGVVLLLATPRYPWYGLLLVPFVVLSGRWEWLTVPLAMTLRQLQSGVELYRGTLAASIAVIIVVTLVRTPRSQWRRYLERLLGQRLSSALVGAVDGQDRPRRVER